MFELGFKLLVSYLLGSVNGSLVLGRLRGVDIRNEGSGNAGATNALRSQGLAFAFWVALIDLGKGAIAVALIAPAAYFENSLLPVSWIAAACGLAAIIGHIFPFWFDFVGGKGGATAVGALLALSPIAVVPVVIVWVILVIGTGFVGLATIIAATGIPVFVFLYRPYGLDLPLLVFGAATAALVIFAHRSNIRNLRDGTEHRMEGAMFWKRHNSSS